MTAQSSYYSGNIYETNTNERGNKMTTTSNELKWAFVHDTQPGRIVEYCASGPGFDARLFTRLHGPIGWHASVELANGETLNTNENGHRSAATCRAWAQQVVSENA